MPEKWRKQQACQRCREFKVRCEYESMDSRSCNRCLKASKECTTVQLRTASGGVSGISKRARNKPSSESSNNKNNTLSKQLSNGSSTFVEYRENVKSVASSLCSPQTREDRITELSHVIREARLEIDLLRTQIDEEKGTGQLNINNSNNKDSRSFVPISQREPYKQFTAELISATLRRRDVIQAAVDMGLYTYQELRDYYEEFGQSSALFCPFVISPWRLFEEMAREVPLLTLAIVTTIASGKKQMRLERLCFAERMINERILMDGQMNTETVKVLLVCVVFFGPRTMSQNFKNPITMFYAFGVCLMLDLGCDEDVRVLKNHANECPEAVAEAADRLRVYLGLCVCFTAMAINTSKGAFVKMLNNVPETCEAIEQLGFHEDRRVTTMFKMLRTAQDALSLLADDSKIPFATAQAYYSSALSKLSDLYSILQTLMTGVTFGGVPAGSEMVLYPMRSFYDMLVVHVAEAMMNRILINYTPGDNQMYLIYAQDIYSITAKVIDCFVEIGSWRFRYPKYVYLRPLQAMAAMIRLKFVTDSLGIIMNIDVQTYYERIKSAWMPQDDEITDLDVGCLLERVERWMYLRVRLNKGSASVSGSPNGSASLAMRTTDMMHDILRQVIGSTIRQRNQPFKSELFPCKSADLGQQQREEKQQQQQQQQQSQQQQSQPQSQPQISQFQSASAVIDPPPPPYGYEQLSLELDPLPGQVDDPSVGNDIEYLLKELFADVGVRMQM